MEVSIVENIGIFIAFIMILHTPRPGTTKYL